MAAYVLSYVLCTTAVGGEHHLVDYKQVFREEEIKTKAKKDEIIVRDGALYLKVE